MQFWQYVLALNGSFPFLVLVFVLAGTANTVTNKFLYTTHAVGVDDRPAHPFAKPWFSVWLMFLGMFACLPLSALSNALSWCAEKIGAKRAVDERAALVSPTDGRFYEDISTGLSPTGAVSQYPSAHMPMWKQILLIAVPATCDCVATFLMAVGMLWIPASVWQMSRGSIIIFTAVIRRVYRKKPTRPHQWLGILLVSGALCVVGFASVNIPQVGGNTPNGQLRSGFTEHGPGAHLAVLGMALVVLANAVQATQTVLEERLLHDVDAGPMLVVGFEGFWGLLVTSCFMVVSYFLKFDGDAWAEGNGLHEDTIDSILMFKNSAQIRSICAVYAFCVLIFNVYGMLITKAFNSTARNVLDSIRTMVIWMTMLFTHYAVDHTKGEKWAPFSYLELLGFVILISGIFTFNTVIMWSCIRYSREELEEGGVMIRPPRCCQSQRERIAGAWEPEAPSPLAGGSP